MFSKWKGQKNSLGDTKHIQMLTYCSLWTLATTNRAKTSGNFKAVVLKKNVRCIILHASESPRTRKLFAVCSPFVLHLVLFFFYLKNICFVVSLKSRYCICILRIYLFDPIILLTQFASLLIRYILIFVSNMYNESS